MGENTKISWATHTFNCWWGCTRVGNSPACSNCYAEAWAARCGYGPDPKDDDKFPIWGADAQRRFFGDKHWSEPLKWNKKAEASGERARVFCASMADWAEGRPDQAPHLERLWDLWDRTPWLDKLMLTKRPQLINKLMPARFRPRRDIWQGTTAENQYWLDLRWAFLREVEAAVYWLSIEPLFGPIVLPPDFLKLGKRAWVIVGGESGPHANPMHPDWVRSLRDQCLAAGVKFHFKQWGEWMPRSQMPKDVFARFWASKKNRDDWGVIMPNGEFFRTATCTNGHDDDGSGEAAMLRLGSGKTWPAIDGKEYKEFPEAA